MTRLLKPLLVLVVLGFAGLAGYAYLGDLAPTAVPVTQEIVIEVE